MKIITLIENTCGRVDCAYEHGLSIYIETGKHRILLDTGATDAFIGNARKLGVPLEQVDIVVLSHGHYDHAGGLLAFCEINKTAQIYMQQKACGDFYHGERYIGIDKNILENPQVHFLQGDHVIDEELSIFTNITGRKFYPTSNLALSEVVNGECVQDSFCHEQCLVIHVDNRRILLSGCAHNGILNILDRYQEIYRDMPSLVISGFHMMKKEEYTDEEIKVICDTAQELKKWKTTFYSGHCTGQKALELMKTIMGEQLRELHSGVELEV